jgi:hypothetical protein
MVNTISGQQQKEQAATKPHPACPDGESDSLPIAQQ